MILMFHVLKILYVKQNIDILDFLCKTMTNDWHWNDVKLTQTSSLSTSSSDTKTDWWQYHSYHNTLSWVLQKILWIYWHQPDDDHHSHSVRHQKNQKSQVCDWSHTGSTQIWANGVIKYFIDYDHLHHTDTAWLDHRSDRCFTKR